MTEDPNMPEPKPKPSVVDRDEIRRQVVARAGEESRERPGGGSGSGGLPSNFVMQCFRANELGDGVLYARLHRGQFLYVKKMSQWLRWTGHHWELDIMERHKAAVENVVRAYEAEAARLREELSTAAGDKAAEAAINRQLSALRKRVDDLRGRQRRGAVIDFAHSCDVALAIAGDEIDTKPWLLPCANGVINLRAGELEAGRPEDYLLTACPVEWSGIETPCPAWEAALLDMMDDDAEMVDFLRRLFGYALVGEVIHHIFVVLIGKGRNGKGTIVETIGEVLGTLSGSVRPELWLDNGHIQSSSGPTPDIMALKGKRVIFSSETNDGCRLSLAQVKRMTGNDTLRGRHPNDKYEQQFKPSHTPFLLTNNRPHADSNDFAFWERTYLIEFPFSYVDRPPKDISERRADPMLPKKLREEHAGILAWCVRGCLEWQAAGGLAPPLKVLNAVREYQRDEDVAADFAEECLVNAPGAYVTARQLYTVFEAWWRKSINNKPPKEKRFGTMMSRRYDKKKDGVIKYLGIDLSPAGAELLTKADGGQQMIRG